MIALTIIIFITFLWCGLNFWVMSANQSLLVGRGHVTMVAGGARVNSILLSVLI